MGKKFGYACVSSSNLRRTDPEALKKTKAYTALEETFRFMKLRPDHLYMDHITANYRNRKNLDRLLKEAAPGDVVIITSASSLGFTPEELRQNYYRIVSRSIGLFVWDEQISGLQLERLKAYSSTYSGQQVKISTVGPDLDLPKEMYFGGRGLPYAIVQTMQKIDRVKIHSNKGPSFKGRPPLFKEVYWLYENYFLKEKDLLQNDAIHIGKKRFYRLATEYEEEDPAYIKDQQEQERLYQISRKPKRHGTVPENFGEFLARVDSKEPLSQVIKEMGYPRLTPIDVERYRLKHIGGRSSLALANSATDTPQAKKLVEAVMEKGRSMHEAELPE